MPGGGAGGRCFVIHVATAGLLQSKLSHGETSKADRNIRQHRSIAQTANTLNTAVGEAIKSSDGRGASVQPVSHELVGKINHKEEETE